METINWIETSCGPTAQIIDRELLQDIECGIKDVISRKVKEI